MYQLFIFFMITDPKTTVRTRTGPVSYTHLDVYKRQRYVTPEPFRNALNDAPGKTRPQQ